MIALLERLLPLGTVAPTGRDIAVRTIDDLGLLRQLDAARLNG